VGLHFSSRTGRAKSVSSCPNLLDRLLRIWFLHREQNFVAARGTKSVLVARGAGKLGSTAEAIK
jgi:hypothetical protein